MKRSWKFVSLIIVFIFTIMLTNNVDAKEVYYVNEKGFEFDQTEYNFFTKVYGEKFVQKYLDENIYSEFSSFDFLRDEVKTKVYKTNESRQESLRSNPYYSTPVKDIRISNVCNAYFCKIYLTATWLGDPSVKSYDDIGVYHTSGISILGTPITAAYSDSDTNLADATKTETDGYGASVELPQGDDIIVNQNFIYSGTGTFYGSYQHAITTIPLSTAVKYDIDILGYGGVFDFYEEAVSVYDDMDGVDLDV